MSYRLPLVLVALGLALHFAGALWHDIQHSHEGLQTLWTQAGFYIATAFVLAGAALGVVRSGDRLRLAFGAALAGALIETGGWGWDFAAHFAGGTSEAAHGTVYTGSAIAVVGILAAVILIWLGRPAEQSAEGQP